MKSLIIFQFFTHYAGLAASERQSALDLSQHPQSEIHQPIFSKTIQPLDNQLSWAKRFNGDETFNTNETHLQLNSTEVAKPGPSTAMEPESMTGMKMDGQGVIKGLQVERGKVKISHGAIDKYGIPAMTMAFKVEDAAMLEGLTKNLKLTRLNPFLSAIELGPTLEKSEGETDRGFELEFRIPIFDTGGIKTQKAKTIYDQAQAQAEVIAISAASNARQAVASYRANLEIAKHYRDIVLPLRERSMSDMGEMIMPLPYNILPMMTGEGQFGPIEMGCMFTVLKIRADQKPNDFSDPGWYDYPAGTVAYEVDLS